MFLSTDVFDYCGVLCITPLLFFVDTFLAGQPLRIDSPCFLFVCDVFFAHSAALVLLGLRQTISVPLFFCGVFFRCFVLPLVCYERFAVYPSYSKGELQY